MKKIFSLFILLMILSSPLYAAVRFGQGTKTITTAGTSLALIGTSTYVTSLAVCGDSNNTGKVIIAETPVGTAGAQQGIVLGAGSCASVYTSNPYNAFDISGIKADVTVSGEEVSFFWMNEIS